MRLRFLSLHSLLCLLAVTLWSLTKTDCTVAGADGVFRAGAACVDVTPTKLPAIIAGGFLEAQSSKITDRLHARAIVLSDGATTIALVVVDTCMMTQQLIDDAKQMANRQCGLAVDKMMVSATHTHSAPAAMGCLGTRVDKEYAAWLPGKIAEAITAAHARLQPARIGWSSVDDWHHTHNRRWIRKPEKKIVDPFGKATGLAHMHPGYLSRDVIGPSGPVDPELSVLAVQSLSGRPLAVLANYSQHYFGSPAVSADYYGHFCKFVAAILNEPGEGNGPFVCAISQGTSGDLMWMDYGSPAQPSSAARYAEEVAGFAQQALSKIQYHDHAPLAMIEKKLSLKYRVPDQDRLAWARPIAARIENDLPKNQQEVYAREALILHDRQSTELKVQAIRIGQLTIATLPNEVYALTGLKLKGRSPSTAHFNIELANGAEGYIPPPEQHTLGGYTTWPARTAGLEPKAEPAIVDALVNALEQVSGKQRRLMRDEHGTYAQAILKARPVAYWRLNDEDGDAPRNAVEGAPTAYLSPGFAWYLPGVRSGTGIGDREALTPSPFSGPNQINRAVHLAGGMLTAPLEKDLAECSLAFWFWLGQPSGASERSGTLCVVPGGERLIAHQFEDHSVQLELGGKTSSKKWPAEHWHFVVLARSKDALRIYLDGSAQPVLESAVASGKPLDALRLGEGLQGKLDEVAVFDRALSPEDIQSFWKLSGVAEEHETEAASRQRAAAAAARLAKAPSFPPGYAQAILDLRPIMMESLAASPKKLQASGSVSFAPESYANFRSGRLSGRSDSLGDSYSVSLWFRNELPASARPVTAYLFSRGADGDKQAPGDHLGIGGTYRADLTGKIIVFNGNARDQVAAGRTVLTSGSWHHVVFVRDKKKVRVYLNGEAAAEVKAEIDAEVDATSAGVADFFVGARSDHFAPLQGQVAYLALFACALTSDEARQLHAASGQKAGAPTASVTSANDEPEPPLSAEQSLAKIHVPPGFRVELVASEPQVVDPVAFDWDPAGRLWVVEMADYPLGMDGKGKPGGRVRVLEDVDDDGRYEKSHVFADGLSFPNGILTWRDGVLVTAAPQILFLRDVDGDGRADQREVLFDGFQQGNQQLRMNGLRWGIDNWVYCANGGHHANYGVGTKVTSMKTGQSYQIGSRDFRFQPDTGELVIESGPSQFGRNRDAWGHWFGTQNAKPLWHYVIADRYLARNPYVPTPNPIRFVLPPGSPEVFPASRAEKRFHSFKEAGHFTSACSGMIYGDQRLFASGPSYHAFTCEPFHNLVQHNLLYDDGVSFGYQRPVGEGTFDFFASEDRWCRPVMVRTGPDGGLWIADMARYMIEHPDWLPPEGKSELLPHYRLGDDLGRIYRIVPQAGSSEASTKSKWALDKHQGSELVAALESSNDWRRDKAQQLLFWSRDLSAAPHLERLVRASQRPQARAHALYLLDALNLLSDELLIAGLQDPYAGVRENAILLAERRTTPEVIEAAIRLKDDPDAKVCCQLALTLGQWQTVEAGRALVELAKRFYSDALMTSAIMSSALTHASVFAKDIVNADPQVLATFREPLLRQSIGAGDSEVIALLLSKALDGLERQQMEALDDFLLTLQRLGAKLDRLAASDASGRLMRLAKRVDESLAELIAISQDASRGPAERLSAASLLCRSDRYRATTVASLAQWLDPQYAPSLQAKVLTILSQSGESAVPGILARAWQQLSPALRNEAVGVWLSRAAWTNDLLDRLETGELAVVALDLQHRARLLQYPDQQLAGRASRLFKDAGTSPRQQVVDEYQKSLALMGDAARGRQVYARACASCHRRGAEGFEVGPNLGTVVGHSPEKLLVNILNPNADIQPGYQSYTCLLESGEILSGILVGETANSVTIKQAGAISRTISRLEIEKLKSTNMSFMPEGLEAMLSPQDMADVLALLKQPVENAGQ